MVAVDRDKENGYAFLNTYWLVYLSGEDTFPRGTVCKEQADHALTLNMNYSPLTSFRARQLNLKYAKEEFLWYLRADKFDASIEQHASMWAKIKQPDGSYFSNYGQYLFPEQFRFIIEELQRDPWSRRASMVLLKPEHLFADNKDVVCTYAINFSIRRDRLNMRVHMRSNDVIFGMTNDVFCFSMLYRLVYAILKENGFVKGPGYYRHMVDSMHVYERHFKMIQDIINEGLNGYTYIDVPWPSAIEAVTAIECKGAVSDDFEWGRWMHET